MEATADSESLTPWTSLPDTEKARLTDVCQRALDRDHTADIINILQENTAKTPPEIP